MIVIKLILTNFEILGWRQSRENVENYDGRLKGHFCNEIGGKWLF